MTSTFLHDAWAALGGAPQRLERVVIEGDTGLACPLPVADLAVGAVAAHHVAAAELAEALGGTQARSPIRLDAAHVAASFQSERHTRLDGRDVAQGFAPLSRFWPAADGWVRLHANFAHHRAAAESVLGADPGAAIAGSAAADVERDVVAAGGVAAMVRDPAQWAAHPAGRAVDSQLLTLSQVADGAARRRPVAGLRVLDLTRVIAGPVGTRTLASYGADVVRVDSPRLDEDALEDTGSGKRCCRLDLEDRHDLATFLELLGAADVLVHGYRPGALDRFGLDGPSLAQRLPDLVVVALDAWGRTGPWGARRGFDSIVQAASGVADVLRQPDGTPGALPVQALDHGTGHLIAATVLRALTSSAVDGGTWHGELSLVRSAHWLLVQAGAVDASAVASAPAQRFLIDLPGDTGTTTVVSPPGTPPWTHGPLHIDAAEIGWREQR